MGRARLVALLVGILGVAALPVAAGATSGTGPTPTTTPTSGAPSPSGCMQGVTFELLNSRKAHKVKVKATRANIRELPGLECPILIEVRRGKRLAATGPRARADKAVWLEVKGKFGRGWIYEGLVRDA